MDSEAGTQEENSTDSFSMIKENDDEDCQVQDLKEIDDDEDDDDTLLPPDLEKDSEKMDIDHLKDDDDEEELSLPELESIRDDDLIIDEAESSKDEKDGENIDKEENQENESKTEEHNENPETEEEDYENSGNPKVAEESSSSEEEEENDEDDDDKEKSKQNVNEKDSIMTRKRIAKLSPEEEPKRKKEKSESGKESIENRNRHDKYCWVCHKEGVFYFCKICPRSYHARCLCLPDLPDPTLTDSEGKTNKNCVCPECLVVMKAENVDSRSEAMKQLTIEDLIEMLKFICSRLKSTPGVDPFLNPVQPDDAFDYYKYIVYPMDITTLEKNIKGRQYGSTEAFLSDFQWIVHNSIIFNSSSSPYTSAAKRLLKVCKQELMEIETCPQCYSNAHNKPDIWFIDACKRPHMLVWAKLKGFPFWPAKAMKIKDEQVDVRFFGQHDRAWVYLKDCYLYSEEMPTQQSKKNNSLHFSIQELNNHIEKLKEMHGDFVLAKAKTHLGPVLSPEEIKNMLPNYKPIEELPKQSKMIQQKMATSNVKKSPSSSVKSPMTITISSIKTNPTIINVSNSISPEGKATIKRRTSSSSSSHPKESDATNKEEEEDKTATAIKKENDEFDEDKDKLKENNDEVEEEEKEKEKDAMEGEDDKDEVIKSEVKKEEEEPIVPKGESILASALGLKRITRRSSQEESDGRIQESKRLKVALMGGSSKAEMGSEDESVDDGLNSESLKKFFTKNSSPVPQLPFKESPIGDIEIPGEDEEDSMLKNAIKRKDFMEQISNKAQTNPGYRFNLSKDISISAIGDDDINDKDNDMGMKMGQIGQIRTKPNLGVQRFLQNNKERQQIKSSSIKHLKPIPAGPGLAKRMNSSNSARALNQMSGVKEGRQQNRQGNNAIVVDSTSLIRFDNSQFNQSAIGQTPTSTPFQQINQLQGAITLPGGTITISKLHGDSKISSPSSNVNGGLAACMKQSGSNGPLSITSESGNNFGHLPFSGKTNVKKRNLNYSYPPSVVQHISNFNKNVADLMKNTVDHITNDILENNGNNSNNKILFQEIEKSNKARHQEIMELRHHQDVAIRELRSAFEIEKKRLIRQMEQEKNKAVNETKKKQWCACCGEEALFYCCWNTSYCRYSCQEKHWQKHMGTCTQIQNQTGEHK